MKKIECSHLIIKRLKNFMLMKKADKEEFIYGKDIIKFLKTGKHPTLFGHSKKKYGRSRARVINSKMKRALSIEGGELYFYRDELLLKTNNMISIEINDKIKETVKEIVKGNIKTKLTDKILSEIDKATPEGHDSSVYQKTNLEYLLLFSDYYKELIWYLVWEEELLTFSDLLKKYELDKKLLKDFSKNLYLKIKSKLKNHSVKEYFIRENMTLNESLLWWDRMLKNYPNLIGVMETHSNLAKQNKKLEEYLIELETKNNEFLIEPLVLDSTIDGTRELVTKKDLKDEGFRMKHCVGGYSENVRRNSCRIFHIESEDGCATLEVGIRQGKVKLIQLKGKGNAQVNSDSLLYIVDCLLKEISLKYPNSIKESEGLSDRFNLFYVGSPFAGDEIDRGEDTLGDVILGDIHAPLNNEVLNRRLSQHIGRGRRVPNPDRNVDITIHGHNHGVGRIRVLNHVDVIESMFIIEDISNIISVQRSLNSIYGIHPKLRMLLIPEDRMMEEKIKEMISSIIL